LNCKNKIAADEYWRLIIEISYAKLWTLKIRDESFFNQSVRTINQPGHLTLFIAGGAHADTLHRRIVDQGIQPEGLLIAGMKPITELHRNAMRARYDYFK